MKSCETISVVVKKINETCENKFEIEKLEQLTWKLEKHEQYKIV